MKERVKKKRCDSTILTDTDIENIKYDYLKGGLNSVEVSKKYHIGASRLRNIMDTDKSEVGGFVDRQAGETYKSQSSVSDKLPVERSHLSSEVESEPPPPQPVANYTKPHQPIDPKLLDDLTKEAEESLEQLNQRRWKRVRGTGGLLRSH